MRIMLVAGDPSGDLYGSMLIRALKRAANASFDAVGGRLMKKALGPGDAFHHDMASMGMTGFVEPARKIPTFLRVARILRGIIAAGKADAVICIDFYGFNRRIMSHSKAAGIPTYYYISPQVWASRPGRVEKIKRFVDKMLVIFPFEERLYRKAGVPVAWVGHPLLDLLPSPNHDKEGAGPMRLGLLPGSRKSEVRRHLPVFLDAASRILKDYPDTEVSVFGVPEIPRERYTARLARWRTPKGERARLVLESDYSERRKQDFVLTSSGTATLENALLGLPMVVIYKVSWPTYLLARAMVSVRQIAMANILAGKPLVPELIQHRATPAAVAGAALEMLASPRKLRTLRSELAAIRAKLGGGGATKRAAEEILSDMKRRGGR